MTDLAKLVVRLEAETAKYMAGMEKAQARLAKFEGATDRALTKIRDQILGAFTVAKIVQWGQASIDAADRMGKLAQETGIATDVISEMGYAAGLSNIGTEELAKSLQKLATTAVDAAKGGKSQSAAFKQLGVDVTDTSGRMRETDEILLDIADRFSQLEDGAQKAALAQDLFGKSGAKLIPFLNQGRAGIEALRAEAKKLGISLTDEAAAAASEFNDNMTRLKAAATGVASVVTQKLLPYLMDLTDTMIEIATEGSTLEDVIDGIVTVFKTFATVGLAANIVFQTIGQSIGTLVYAFEQLDFSPGDFTSPITLMAAIGRNAENAGKTVDILREGFDQIGMTVDKNVGRIKSLWTEADNKLKEVDVTAKKLKETLGGIGGDAIVQEVEITAKKIEKSPVDQLLDDFDARTQTSFDKAQVLYNEEKEMLEQLLAAKRISIDEYNERIGESFDKFLPEFEVTVDKIKDKTKKATDELTEYQKEVQRNTIDILAGGLETALDEGISKGADGALDAFKDMIQKMLLQALAADIAGALFGEDGKGGMLDFSKWFGGGGGASGTSGGGGSAGFMQALGSFFGGSMDSGGRGKKGVAYAIGTGAQPEMFVPDSPGTFIPADQLMGMAQRVTQNIYVQGRVDQRSARQLELEASRRQNVARSRLG